MDLPAILLVAGTLVGLVLPGYLLLRGLRIPPVVALSAAPAILVGILTPLTVMLRGAPATGQGWLVSAWAVAGAMSVIGAILWWLSPRLNPVKREPSRLFMGVALGVTALVCIITVHQVLAGMGGLDVPLQRRDSVSHYNAIAGIYNGWGTVHPLETRGWMIGATGSVSYYPSTFHAIAAAIPVSQGVVAGNLLALVCALLWIIGLTVLARVAFPAYPGAWIAAPMLTLVAISFPFIPLFRQGQWPFGLGLALTPGLVALFVYSARSRSVIGGLAGVVGLIGIVGAHPSGIAVFGFLLVSAALVEVAERSSAVLRRRARSAVRMSLPTAVILILGAVGAYVIADRSPAVINMGSYPRAQTPAPELVGSLVTFRHFNVNEPFDVLPAIGVIPLLLLGTILLFTYAPARPFFVAGLLLFGTLLLTPTTWQIAHITGAFWYGDPERILGVLTLLTILAAALGVGWLGEKIAPRVQGNREVTLIGVSLLIVTTAVSFTWVERAHIRSDVIVGGNYQPSRTSPYFVGGPAWTEDDDRFWDEASMIVGSDGVMTDSASGGILLPSMKNVRAVPAITTLDSLPEHGKEAAWGLRDSGSLPPAACVFLRENTIRWVYLEEASNTRFADSHFRSDLMEPHGEIVLKDGPRELWRIDDCRR